MSARTPTVEARLDALTASVERLAAAVVPIILAGAPAPVVAAAPATATAAAEPQHIGPSGKPDGRRFPCTADGGCGRMLRSEKRASIHGVDAGGHTAAA